MRPRQVSDEEILSAARSVFLEHGASVSTNVIADKLGVSQATLFKRFGTKEDLLIAALEPRPEESDWMRLAEEGPDDRPLRTQLVEIAHALESFVSELIPRAACIRSSGLPMGAMFQRQSVPPPLRGHKALAGWFGRARDAGRLRAGSEPEVVAAELMGTIHMRHWVRHVAQSESHVLCPGEDFVDRLVDNLWSGLAPPEVA